MKVRFHNIKLFFWLCLVVLFTVPLSVATVEQAPGLDWQKCPGGSSYDFGSSIEQTSEGGYIVAGGSYSVDGDVTGNHGSQDAWVVKLDNGGDVVWQKCLGGSSSDYGSSIEQTSDSGYIVAGFSNSVDGDVTGNHGSQDAWVVKLDESGDVVWQKCLGGSSPDYGNSIERTSDGSYIVVGYSNSTDGDVTGNHGGRDSWVVKLDNSGDIVWQKCLGGSSTDFGSSIEQTSDGGYIVAGGSNSNDGNVTGNHGSQDAWIVKLDNSGDVVWQKCLGGSSTEAATSIEQTPDDGYVVAGYSNSTDGDVTGNHGSQDAWVVKLDESGDVVWQKCLGGSSVDYVKTIKQTPDDGYVVAGYSGSTDGDVTGNHGSHDSWVVKLDNSGDIVWQKCLGGSSVDYARSIEQTPDDGYVVAGYSGSTDGDVTGNHGNDDYWIVKLSFQAPVADFSAAPASGSAPLNVSFTDNSTGNPTSWLWNFDDGANSVEQNPVHTYSTAGNYTVNLTVSNENGTSSKFVTINVSEKPVQVIPVASFNSNVTSGYAPLSVQFNDTSSSAPTSWEWDFGDGSPNSTEQNPNHTYNSPGTYTVVLRAFNAEGSSTNKQTDYIAVLNNSDSGSLTLVNTDFSQLSSIPRGMYVETTSSSAPSNITLAYNSALKCADITYIKPASGNLFFTNLYPATDSNITYTLGTEGVSSSSYLNIIASNSIVSVSKRSSGDYRITSYWIADDKSSKSNYITVPTASIIDNKVTFSMICYESNRTNVLKYNDTIYTKTPFRTINTRNQNYVFVNQPMVYFSPYFASGDTGPYVVHLYSIKQEIPRKTITPHGTRSISALTLSYPDQANNGNGTDLMKSNGQKSTVYASVDHLDDDTVTYQKALLDEGWELGVYYTTSFNSVSNETAIATMDSEYNTIVNTFGRQPKTWTALGGSGNISQAIYAYQRYGMIWRTCESGASWLSVGNLCNTYWRWWNTSIEQGVVFPAFTIATDKEPVTGSSINASYFKIFSSGFAANNIRLCGLSEYYFTQSAQNTTQVNITDSNNSYMRFTVNTGGYPCTLNVMTNMSNVEISHDGVTVPYISVDDGVIFTATNNSTYVLRALSPSLVADFTSNLTSGNVPFTVQFNDTSAGSPTSWDWNFGDETHSSTQNATHTFTTAGTYNVTLTALTDESSSTIMKSIIASENPVLPVANFSSNVTEGYAPLTIQFNDTSSGAPTSWGWDFGDGSPNSTEQNSSHIYNSAGKYTVVLSAYNAEGNSTCTKINYITALNNSDSGSLTLVNTDFSQLSSIPRGMYVETTSSSAPSNITLAYNSALKCADITYIKPASGNLFFTNLYPSTDSNITYTLGTEGVSSSSYLNIITSNSIVTVSKRSSGDYRITSYWTADDKTSKSNYITIPVASIIDNKVTFSVVCYESNRTNALKYNDTINIKTPFRTINTRNQNYVFVNQPMVYFSPYFASGDTGPYVVHLYSIKQEIPRKTITPHGTRSISALTLSYPDQANNGNGTDLMKSNGQKSTVYASADHLDNATVTYQKALLDEGWELGIHYTVNLGTISNETAIATMDDEYNTIVDTFGKQPKTWTALGGSGNISQARYAYQRYGMIWHSCESGASWLSIGNLCNPYWQWWNTSIAHGIVFPAFTIATDKEPVTGNSINASYFKIFSSGFAANNIRLCGLSEYYFTQSAQNTTQVNITDSNNSYMRFTVNTCGYPCTLNVMTNISNVEISHDGVTVPHTSVDDGVVFTATNNSTYVLRALSPSLVADFTSNLTSGNVPFTVQFNDTSAGSPTSWDWNFGDETHSSTQNATHMFTTAGFYNVTLTALTDASSSTIMKSIIALEKPVLPVANFSTNVSEGYAPLTIQFNDSSENATGWNWDFGDEANSTVQNPEHTFSIEGNYTVTLVARNGDGSSGPKSMTITVNSVPVQPVANFTANPIEGPAPLTVQFTDWSENADTVNWNFNRDEIVDSKERNPVHKYANPGAYTVKLTAGNKNGTDSKLATITVLKRPGTSVPPVANFNTNVSEGYAPLSVQFTDLSEHAVSWNWDFNKDGRIDSSYKDPIYSYAVPGIYTVKLTVSNADGRSSKLATIKVLEQPEEPVLPEANFRSNISEGYAPLSVQFTDYSKHAVSWSWDFDNDGQVDSISKDSGYVYSAPGIYTVKLTVANKNGTDSMSAIVRVLERSNPVLPVANFSSNVTEGYAPLNVQFTDSSENTAGVTWDFNDDGIVDSTSRTPVHVYAAPGTYKVNLTAVNENGSTAKTASITVLERNSSSGGSSSGGRDSSDGRDAGSSHEPAKNVEVKELSQAVITGGEPVRFNFPRKATSVLSITFDSKKTAGKTTTIVEMLKDKSTLTPYSPEGEVYGYINIWVGNSKLGIESDIENAVIYFRVEKSWIDENNFDQASIVLNRYSEGKWNPLPTSLSGEDDRYFYFTAKTPGFSPFAITGKKTVVLTEIQSENNISEQNRESKGANAEQRPDHEGNANTFGKGGTGVPSFEAVYGIACLLTVFLYRKERK